MGMDTHDALLAAVRAHPDDDTPRLVLADWLEENGQADRAAFIRSQVEAARTPCPECRPGRPCRGGGRCRKRRFRRRERELLGDTDGDWFGLPGWDMEWRGPVSGPGEGDVTWFRMSPASGRLAIVDGWLDRGFVGRVECDGAEWLEFADVILAAHPVRRVTLTTWPAAEIVRINPRTLDHVFVVAGREVSMPERDLLAGQRGRLHYGSAGVWALITSRRWPGIAFTLSPTREPLHEPVIGPGWENRLVPPG